MKAHRKPLLDAAEMAAIERDLDDLEALLRKPRKARPVESRPCALRPRPTRFVLGLVGGLKPHVAAAQAGYRGARMAASRLMRDPRVRTEIERLKPRATPEMRK